MLFACVVGSPSCPQFLKSVSLLSPLTDAQRDTLSSVLEEMTIMPKETIVREGDVADCLYLIKSGECIAYKAEDGKPKGKELGRMGQQDFFGESSLEKEGDVRQATVVAGSKARRSLCLRGQLSNLGSPAPPLREQIMPVTPSVAICVLLRERRPARARSIPRAHFMTSARAPPASPSSVRCSN